MKVKLTKMTLEFEDVDMDVTPTQSVLFVGAEHPTAVALEKAMRDSYANGIPTMEEVSAKIKARIAERFGHGPAHIEGSPSPK